MQSLGVPRAERDPVDLKGLGLDECGLIFSWQSR
jgi:hypothetical protein